MTLKRAAIIVTSAVALGTALGLLSARLIPPAHADEEGDQVTFACGPRAKADEMAHVLGGAPFVTLTGDQWQFIRGVFVMAPHTPAALPPGDSAALSMRPDGSGSIISSWTATALAPRLSWGRTALPC